ncbi:hypothetical protein Q1695_012594 [Nippostrongylus brasiliensis]|nr:hypothetical protein Q1695_012594 [Nippostrongylus brasiliensis]
MAGIPVPFVGAAVVRLQIGRTELSQLLHFTEEELVPRSADTYDIILGNDVLQRLPPWSLNYSARVFRVDGDVLPIVDRSPSTSVKSPIPKGDVRVHSSSTVVLPPGTESIIPCYVVNADSSWSAVWTQAEQLFDESVFVAPAVFPTKSPVLCLSNPSDTPKVIYRDQRLTTAHPLVELPNGTVQELTQRF